jgi:uncharacterized membrane protein YgcG
MTQPGPEPDPDPTPTASPWEEYRAAAQSLDAVRREAVAAAAAATRAASSARAELAQVSARLAQQQVRLAREAARLGVATPPLTPSPAEQAAAAASVAGGPAAVPEALHHCQRLVEAVDTELAGSGAGGGSGRRGGSGAGAAGGAHAAGGHGWWPPPLWLTVAGGLAMIALACAVWLLG